MNIKKRIDEIELEILTHDDKSVEYLNKLISALKIAVKGLHTVGALGEIGFDEDVHEVLKNIEKELL
jgi:hypothetical protein